MKAANPIVIPVITELPTSAPAAAAFLWTHQDKLNQVSHPQGRGTIGLPKHVSAQEHEGVALDYCLALASEVNELGENCFWKHWSSEARAGRRFQLLSPEGQDGNGTAQNVLVEITDIAFFTVSLLQAYGMSALAWVKAFGDEAGWQGTYGSPGTPADMREILRVALKLSSDAGQRPFCSHLGRVALARGLQKLCMAAGLGWRDLLSLYSQKLVKNYERQRRGRQQVGDLVAERENAAVLLKPATQAP